MGNCVFCQKAAGLFRSKHAECETAHVQKERTIEDGRQRIKNAAKEQLRRAGTYDVLETRIVNIEELSLVPRSERRALLAGAWEDCVAEFLEDGVLPGVNYPGRSG